MSISQINYDVIIIGGGPGGYVTAIRATQLGFKVALVEAKDLGGVCLNWGCIPTKALLRCSEINHLLHNLETFGFSAENIKFDITKIVKRSRKIARQLSGGITHLLKKNKVDVYSGWGRLTEKKGTVSVEHDNKIAFELNASHIILATGARANTLLNIIPDGKQVCTYAEAMVPQAIPKSLLIVGAGAIGIEFASFYRSLGSAVTVIEALDRILPVEDTEISNLASKYFKKRGIEILTSTRFKSLERTSENVVAIVEIAGKTKEIKSNQIIMAVGVVGNVEDLGLENAKIEVTNSHISTNKWCETSASGIYAIGDVAGAPWLAHKASHEGIICIEKIAGIEDVKPLNRLNIPNCVYCQPQIASIGLTEEAARNGNRKVKVGKFPLIASGKAVAMGDTEGMVKTIFDSETGEFLGAHMIGAEVTEMIQGYGIAKTMKTTKKDFYQTIFAHPTISEAMNESILNADDRAIHV